MTQKVMNKILLIDTSSNKEIRVGLKINQKEYVIRQKIGNHKAQVILPMIESILRKRKLKITDINNIEVNTQDKGSFTGIRVGMSVANALSFALEIPVKKIK